MSDQPKDSWKTFTEEIEVAGQHLVDEVNRLLAEGNLRKLEIRSEQGDVYLSVPLTAGALAGGVVALAAPWLAVIAALKARGLGPVIASDYSPARRRVAEAFGADVVIDPAAENPHSRWSALGVPHSRTERSVLALTGNTGKRAVIFECVGNAPFERVERSLKPGGTLLLVIVDLKGMLGAGGNSRRSGKRVIPINVKP